MEKTTNFSADNEELAALVKVAVAEAIKEATPTLVEDVVSQLTNKTQALVDAQVAVFRGEMVAMQAEISKCVDYMEKDENRVEEMDSRLSSSANWQKNMHSWRTKLPTWKTGRAETMYVCMESLKAQRH